MSTSCIHILLQTQEGGCRARGCCLYALYVIANQGVFVQVQKGRMEQELSQAGDELDKDLERDLQRMRLQEKQPTADPGTAGRL